MLLSNLKIFKRQVLILTATVFKMPVSRREQRRTLEKANGNETGEELNKKKERERERHLHDTFSELFHVHPHRNPGSLAGPLPTDRETEAHRGERRPRGSAS